MTQTASSQIQLDPGLPTGLLLSGMGGPDGPDAVGPFLRNLFADPAILPLPAPLARLLGAFIARRRTAAVKERYLAMGLGGASPQLGWVRRQGAALEERLAAHGITAFAEPAMRYWHPYPEEAVAKLLERGAKQMLVLPTYPQFSEATTGSIATAIAAALGKLAPAAPALNLWDWHMLSGYLQTLVERPAKHLAEWAAAGVPAERCALVFTAHSLPERFIKRGDPYLDQTLASVGGAHRFLRDQFDNSEWLDGIAGGREPLLGFQSRVGPVRWIGPNILAILRELAAGGTTHLIIQPVSFSCEHIETKHELDTEFKALAKGLGIEVFERGPALNLNPVWLDSQSEMLVSHFAESRNLSEVGHA